MPVRGSKSENQGPPLEPGVIVQVSPWSFEGSGVVSWTTRPEQATSRSPVHGETRGVAEGVGVAASRRPERDPLPADGVAEPDARGIRRDVGEAEVDVEVLGGGPSPLS